MFCQIYYIPFRIKEKGNIKETACFLTMMRQEHILFLADLIREFS